MSDFDNWEKKMSTNLNASATEFVPNANAQAFSPGMGWAYGQPYGGGLNQMYDYGQLQQQYAQQPYVPQTQPQPQPQVAEPVLTGQVSPQAVDSTPQAESSSVVLAETKTEAKVASETNETIVADDWEAAEEGHSGSIGDTEKDAPVEQPATQDEGEPQAKEPENFLPGTQNDKTDETDANVVDDDDDDDEDDDDTTTVPVELEDRREHLNIVFIGHVDAGKSTIGGHLMYLTGNVDKRTLDKYEREAREKNRESWYLSWAMDTNDEERAKGKTVECGQGHFTTENKHFTVIDAPGHKSFVPNMISGAAQADIAVLVISARKGEFETGFDRGGQTREHAMLAKTAGVKNLIVVVNKMDDPTVEWQKARYDEIVQKLLPFLRQTGFKKEEVTFIPVSGLKGINLTVPLESSMCDWYTGPSLVEFLDSLPKIVRLLDKPFRMPITDKYKDMGVIVMGKIQSGYVKKAQRVLIMPNKERVAIDTIWSDDQEVESAVSGDNVKIKLKNVEEDNVNPGHVLCLRSNPCSVCTCFDAQLVILDWKSIICAGFNAVLHIHAATEEVVIKGFICHVSKKTGKPDKEKGRPRFVKQGDVCIARLQCAGTVCIETFQDHPQMGRFTLRDEGMTLAIGKVVKLVDPRE